MPRKVVVRLKGGLGNQMFQYAAGFAMAVRNEAENPIGELPNDVSIHNEMLVYYSETVYVRGIEVLRAVGLYTTVRSIYRYCCKR